MPTRAPQTALPSAALPRAVSPSPPHSHRDYWLGITQKNISITECQVLWQAGSRVLQADQICTSCSQSVLLHLA